MSETHRSYYLFAKMVESILDTLYSRSVIWDLTEENFIVLRWISRRGISAIYLDSETEEAIYANHVRGVKTFTKDLTWYVDYPGEMYKFLEKYESRL